VKRAWVFGGVAALVLFVLLAVVTVILPESTNSLPGSLTNSRPNGSRALGQVLTSNGVATTQVTTLDEAAAAPAGATLVVYLDKELSDEAAARLGASAADLVILVARDDATSVRSMSNQLITGTTWWSGGSTPPVAGCGDADATAAGTITPSFTGLTSWYNTGLTTCFTDPDGVSLYADVTTAHHRVTAIAGDRWLRNDTITANGNAALGLRVLGRNAQLVWYLPGADVERQYGDIDTQPDLITLLPGWAKAVIGMLIVAAVAAALWRGRRFGALVREHLPVAVPASEAAGGLGRLYRQSTARGHAAAGLRAATLRRVAAQLGVPPSAGAQLVVERLAEATGRPPGDLALLCYGPPPATDADLLTLTAQLSDLERELTIHE